MMSVAHVDIPGLGCHLRPYGYLRAVMMPVQPLRIIGMSGLELWLRTMVGFVLMSMAHVTIMSHESTSPGGLGTRELIPPLTYFLIRRTTSSPVLASAREQASTFNRPGRTMSPFTGGSNSRAKPAGSRADLIPHQIRACRSWP